LSQGLKTDTQGGGDVKIVPQDNSQTLDAFKQGLIAGAWVPEPWATRLVKEGGGKVLVDERSLWPAGQFVTTELIVSRTLLSAHGVGPLTDDPAEDDGRRPRGGAAFLGALSGQKV